MVREFKLSDSFIEIYREKPVEFGPVGEFTYLRTYSRRIEEEGRNEKWFETVRRVVEGCFTIQKKHCDSLQLLWNNSKAQKSAQIMYDKIFSFKFLPPGRGLWMMGTPFVEQKGSSALMNCAFISTEDIETRGSFAFCWAMDALMLGVGVGFDVRGANKITIKPSKPDGIFQIPDSREGWVEGLRLTLDAFFEGKPLPDYDASLVRPYGTPIKGFGGVASGPEPLLSMYDSIRKLVESRVGQKLRSTDIVDIMNFIGVCVVAGNVRRSAESCIGDWKDTEYVTMKDYKLHGKELTSHRWASNNSIFAEVGKTNYNQFAESIALNGEPGIVWMENIRKYGRMVDEPDYADSKAMGLNPCFEQILENAEMCNLVETFPSRHKDYEEYKDTLKYAYLYAKTVTLVPTHWPESNAIMLKNRRIGLSQSGIIEAFIRHGRRTILDWNEKGYNYIQELDALYSDWLCVPRSKRTTSIKPSGTVSLLPGVTPGIHYPHAEYYIRRVRCPSNNPLVKIMKEAGYKVHREAYGKTDEDKEKTSVIDFPIHEQYFTRGKAETTIWEQVKNAVDYQRTWADNSVSITVTFNKNEIRDIPNVLNSYEDMLKAISFLPLEDTGYELMPYETVTKEKYEEMAAKITKPDFSSIFVNAGGEKYCDGESCLI